MPRSPILLALLLLEPHGLSASQRAFSQRLDALPPAPVRVEDGGRRLVIALPPVDVPPASHGETMVRTPVYRVDIPGSGSIHRYRIHVLDDAGDTLPREALHHVNLNDPSRRELFAPILLHVLAASKETPSPSVPWLFFGMPVGEGDRYIISAMVANDENRPLRAAVHVVLDLVPADRPWPLWDAYPWVMDVKHPVGGPGGSKAFDLPPGRSEHSWEASPAIPGTILGMGGHVHDYATRPEFRDVTTGEVLWHAAPERDADGTVLHLPLARFYGWFRLGKRIEPTHRYRVTVVYDNPTGAVIPAGGMGAVAGLFVPDRGARWPAVDAHDPAYVADLANTLDHMGTTMTGHGHRH